MAIKSPSPGLGSRLDRIVKARKRPTPLKSVKVVATTGALPSPGPVSPASSRVEEKPFRFLDLPGEIRNRIYKFALPNTGQALLKHLPRRATLRRRKPHPDAKRRSRRPYVALAQVCRQIRTEFHPWYLKNQEIGLDLNDVNAYVGTFYPKTDDKVDMCMGNLTIAISNHITAAEKNGNGVDLWPLLDTWTNAYRIQAGFGRYTHVGYDGGTDGEAKDLYRLLCRRVLPSRDYGPLNEPWKAVLASKKIAAVLIQRDPFTTENPSISIMFKAEHKEEWMTEQASPPTPKWLELHGFDNMEYFTVKVGVVNSS